jgi:hypothetical protein
MHILKDGRSAYLEFLRNLTPQIVILSLALVAGHRLQPTCCYPENAKQTFIFLFILATWILALWANSSLFIKNYLVAAEKIDRASRLLIRAGVRDWRNLHLLFCFAWRNERAIFWEVIIVFTIILFGLVIVGTSAISSATTFLMMFHPS